MSQVLAFPFQVIAHRGASGYAPENTLAAFAKAAALNIAWVEFDVMQAASGEVIVFHDDVLERTTSGAGPVKQMTYPDLKLLDSGTWFNSQYANEKILLLEDLLIYLNAQNISANIELKSLPGDEEALVASVLALLERMPAFQPTILFSSFSFLALKLLRQSSPHAKLGLLLHEWEPNWQELLAELNCEAVHVFEEILTKTHCQQIKTMNKFLLSYTVNDPERARELFNWGVDAVFSDYPDRIKALSR